MSPLQSHCVLANRALLYSFIIILLLRYDYLMPVQHNVHSIVKKFMSDGGNKSWENPKNIIQQLRLFKSPTEISLMQKTCDIASEAFVDTIKCSKPGKQHKIKMTVK